MRLRPRLVLPFAAAAAAALVTTALFPHDGPKSVQTTASSISTPSHVVVVMEENHSYADIIGDTGNAPYLNSLASQGALLTSSFGVTHPSEPNYMALFSGSTDGLTADTCPVDAGSTANLGSELLAAGDTFKGYSEGLPSTGSTACTSGEYARKHSPWINFSNVPASDSLPFSSFPTDYSKLPTLSFVTPDLNDDMHDGTIPQADTWLKDNLSAYATWAKANNSLLIVTWDEDDYTENNQIPTLFVGADVKPGKYSETVNHYNLLATLEQFYGLGKVGASASAASITDIWNCPPRAPREEPPYPMAADQQHSPATDPRRAPEGRSPWWRRGATVTAVLALAAAVAGTGLAVGRGHRATTAGSPLAVTAKDCGAPAREPAGPLAFTVTDADPAGYATVYLTDPGGHRVYAEIPWIAPHRSQPLATTLPAGRYALRCVWSDGTVRTSRPMTVTGTTTGAVAGYRPLADLAMTAPVNAYRAWVEAALPHLLSACRTLDADVARGDLRSARTDWLTAHLDYERLGAAYHSFGDFDDRVDGMPDGLPRGVESPDWTGLFSVEYALWHGRTAAGLRPLTRDLAAQVSALVKDFPSEDTDPGDLPLRAHEILENALQFQLTGAADYGSGTTLATLGADLRGTREVVDVLRPLIGPRDPALLTAVDDGLTKAEAAVNACRTADGRWTPVERLGADRRRVIDADVDTLLEHLSSLPGLLAPRTSA